jgi:vacuolar-type H+-ATPase subunit E/Vma4
MSLDAVLEQINQQGASQIKAILAEAEMEAAHIVQQAVAESNDIRNHAGREGKARGAQERAGILQQAQLDALKIIGENQASLIEDAVQQARRKLERAREKETYPGLLCQLTQEAVRQISVSLAPGDSIRLLADPRDESILSAMLPEISHPVEAVFNLHCQGGVIAETSDRQVIVYNTLESRLEHAMPYLREALAGYFESLQNPTQAHV